MKPLSARDPFRVGVALIAVLVLLAVFVVVLARSSFGAHTYAATLAQTAGLRPGEEVEVHGVEVGKVKSTDLDGSAVKVRFTLAKDISMGDRSTAAVKVATLLGTHYLEVDPQGAGSTDSIPLARTSVPYNLQDVLNGGTAELQELDSKALAKALASVADTLDQSKDSIAPALAGVTSLSQVISERSTQTATLLSAAQSVATELKSDSGDVEDLMRQANLVITELTSRAQQIHQLLTGATALSTSISQVIDKTRADLKPALSSLNTVIGTLNGQAKEIKQVLSSVATAGKYVANALGNGPWLDLWFQSPAIPTDDQQCLLGSC